MTAPDPAEQLQDVLDECVVDVYGADSTVENLTKLSAGASRETWAFDVRSGDTVVQLILKRDPMNYNSDGSLAEESEHQGVSRIIEGQLLELGGEAGVPTPEVPFYLEGSDVTTESFVMLRLEGETLGRRILREDKYTDARQNLAFQCGEAAAKAHTISLKSVPNLESMTVQDVIHHQRKQLDAVDHPYPGFEYGLRWLEDRSDIAGDRHTLVHGDFRNGNIIVGEDGLRAVLDWELAHIGNPMSDLGWLCVPSWRYGYTNKIVGGFGDVEDLLAGYTAGGGGEASAESIHYWSVLGALRWGVMCVGMGFSHINGPHHSLERAAIGRRTAETEYDLLQMID